MLNQPPVLPLTLAMTENYEICCHKMSDFKAIMHQIVCRLGLRPRPRLHSVHFVYLYVLCNWPLPLCYKIVPRPMAYSCRRADEPARRAASRPQWCGPTQR